MHICCLEFLLITFVSTNRLPCLQLRKNTYQEQLVSEKTSFKKKKMTSSYFDIEQNAMVSDVTPGPSISPSPSPVIDVTQDKKVHDYDGEILITNQSQVRDGPSQNLHRKVKRTRVRAKVPPIGEIPDLHRRGKKSNQIPLHLAGRYPYIYEQSHAGGWVDDSDSDCSDVFSEVRRVKIDTVKQIYMILGVVIIVIISVSSIYLYEWIYGKPKVIITLK